MLDIKFIRENPEKTNELLKRRDKDLSINEVLDIDKQRREIQTKTDSLRNERKTISQEVGKLKKEGKDTTELQEKVRKIAENIKKLESSEVELNEKQKDMLLNLPNLPDESSPIGSNDEDNKEIKVVGELKKREFDQKPHWDIGTDLNLFDFERGVKISQSRFTIYRGAGARLERAVINFFLDIHTKQNGYEEIIPPFLVNERAMTGTGQLPKFANDMYKCKDDNLYLIPTAEVPLTNIYSNEILKEDDLPLYMAAYTPCFRREAGSAGKDTRGLIRQHQFNKVELVKLCSPETSGEEHEKLTRNAEEVLEILELPYKKVSLCTGDLGFSAKKCYDLEVWFPHTNNFKEISSCSNFGDFQARRANIRYKTKNSKKPIFVHTINGSGLAVGRTVAAILANYQQEDGRVIIPDALQKYFGDSVIKPTK